MRFGLVHRIMTDALAVLGLLSLVTSGDMHRWVAAVVLVGLVASLGVPERLQDHKALRRGGAGASVALLSLQLFRLFTGGDVLELAVEFAAGLQVIRLATRRGAAHDQQIILLALLHLVAGTVLGGGLAYGLCFVGFLVVAPGALVLSHLRREVEGNYRQGARDRTGLPVDVPRILRSRRVISKRFLAVTCSLSIPIFLFTAILFVLFPRVGLSLLLFNHSRSSRMIGFSDRVDLGGVGKLRSDPAIALRVVLSDTPDPPPPRLSLYLRGTAFDFYDGKSWSRTQSGRVPAVQHGAMVSLVPYYGMPNARTMHVDLEPISPPVVFLPEDAIGIRLLARGEPLLGRPTPVFAGPEGEFKYTGDDRGLRYEVYFPSGKAPHPDPLTAADLARYTQVPASVTPRIAALSRDWTRGLSTPHQAAIAIERRLRTDYAYDLDSPAGAATNPLEDFLFESRRGHCEFYSTAMAVLLRTLGIPARNVTGFVGGTYNRFGSFYAVRQGDAHSWVEVYLPEVGWKRFDPTPPSGAVPRAEITGILAFMRDVVEAAAQRWNRHVIGYDLDQQLDLLRSVSERYSSLTADSSFKSPWSTRRLVLFIVGVLTVAGSFYWWWRYRRAESGPAPRLSPKATNIQVVNLYRSLEAAMTARGVPRPASTPPLAHARALLALHHPVGEEVLALTEQYLAVRFGGSELSESEKREYARRVKALRDEPRDAAAA